MPGSSTQSSRRSASPGQPGRSLGSAADSTSASPGLPAAAGPTDSPGSAPAAPPLRTTRRRIPELAVGVVLVGLGAIGALLLAGREPSRASVLVWANDVTRGQVVAESDLRIASIDVDVPVNVLDVAAAADVVGRSVVFDATAGGFVSTAVLDDGSVIPPDFAVVGLRLGPGQYPISTLSAGDVVDLLTSEPIVGWDSPVVASGVEVFDFQWLGNSGGGDALVSLLVPRSAGARVVAATDAGPRLAEVAP